VNGVRAPLAALAALVCAVLPAACSSGSDARVGSENSATPSAESSASTSPTPAVDVASGTADELGVIPVLMYHQMIAHPGRDDLTPEQFRAQVQVLYEAGYRPITAADYVAGQVDVPAGMHPVVLTFDDSTISQARIGPDGEPRPDTALGVLEEFGREHPDFHSTATFYVNTYPPAFTDDQVLPWLVAHGYDVGAHTHSHQNLRRLADDGVQKEIGLNITEIEAAVPGFPVTTLALPEGVPPRNRELARHGSYEGTPYCVAGVLGVDVIAAASPYSIHFSRDWIPRVGTGDADALLESLRLHPERLYVSDGDPNTVAFPPEAESDFNPDWAAENHPC
jgi:peptidoglycan/xylan/chitin deacetylase (PgdA/CDA1 family)